jgi:hypothetical protein
MQIGPLNESRVMTQVALRDSTVKVVAEGELTETDISGQVGTTTTAATAEAVGIPTVALNQTTPTTTGSSFIAEEGENLSIADLTIAGQPSAFRPGDLISFEANVTNPSSQQLNGSFTFAVDNGTITQQTITVPAGGAQSLVFTHRFAEAGNYTVSVGDQTREVGVQSAQTTVANTSNMSTTAANGSSQNSSGGGSGSGGVGGAIGGVFDGIVGIGIFAVVFSVAMVVSILYWVKSSVSKEKVND